MLSAADAPSEPPRSRLRAMQIGIIGLGYVGLPLAVAFAEAGREVVGLDVDARKVEALNAGRSYIEDVPSSALAPLGERLRATADYADLAACEAVILCVPTPLTDSREPDLTYLLDVGDGAGAGAAQPASSSCSSRPPTRAPPASGCCRSSRSPASPPAATSTSPSRRSGSTPAAPTTRCDDAEAGRRPHRGLRPSGPASSTREICDTVVVLSSPEAAELSKLLENIFRSVNIALVNELAQLCDRLGIDVWEVIDAASTKPFGFMRFDPGPGMGGHCLPVDPFYLAFKAREHDFYPEFIELAGKMNQAQPAFCVERIERALNDAGKPVNGSADPHPRRQLQGRRRRHPRIAGAEDHRPLLQRPRRRCLLPRPLRAASCRSSASPRSISTTALARRRPCRDRHRPPRRRLRGGGRPAAPLVVDFRGVTRGIERREPGPALVRRRSVGTFLSRARSSWLLDDLGDQLDHVGVAGRLDVAGLVRPAVALQRALSRPAR